MVLLLAALLNLPLSLLCSRSLILPTFIPTVLLAFHSKMRISSGAWLFGESLCLFSQLYQWALRLSICEKFCRHWGIFWVGVVPLLNDYDAPVLQAMELAKRYMHGAWKRGGCWGARVWKKLCAKCKEIEMELEKLKFVLAPELCETSVRQTSWKKKSEDFDGLLQD